MAAGSISSLGLGSGLDLQNILDQLKEVEQTPIKTQEARKETLQKKINAFNSVNSRLFAMKSHALALSLESDFLKNKVTVSDEEVLTGRVNHGVAESSNTVEIVQKARANSWESVGVASKTALIYTEPTSSHTSAVTSVLTEPETMSIQYGADGDQTDIDIEFEAGLSLSQMVDAINASENNTDTSGNPLVTASVEKNAENQYYIRLRAANGGNSADSQISIQGFDYVKSDATIAIAKANDSTQSAYISIAPGTTYQAAVDLINNSADNPGVQAAIIDDGSSETPFKLVLTSRTTGEENRMVIGNLPVTEVIGKDSDSLNAHLTVNGTVFQRQSNDGIDDLIAGATLSLKKTGETTVSIQNDMDGIKQHILDLVEGFNALMTEIKGTDADKDTQTSEEEGTTDAPLKDDYAAKRMVSDLKSLMGSIVRTGGDYSSLFDLGLSIDRDGVVSLDETALDQAIASDPDGVKALFLGNPDEGITGLGDMLNNGITEMISLTGTVSTEIDAAEQKVERLDKNIASATERLNKRYEIMTAQFSRLDSYINQLNNEANLLTSLIDSFNNTTQNK